MESTLTISKVLNETLSRMRTHRQSCAAVVVVAKPKGQRAVVGVQLSAVAGGTHVWEEEALCERRVGVSMYVRLYESAPDWCHFVFLLLKKPQKSGDQDSRKKTSGNIEKIVRKCF